MNKLLKTSIILISAGLMQSVNSAEVSSLQKPISLRAETNVANMEMVVKDSFIKAKYTSAENRFMQGNIKASHDDFQDLVNKAEHDDYVFLMYGIKMAEFGFFDLSEDLISRLDNNLYTQNYIKDIKNFYYPSGMVESKDILPLSDAYAVKI